MLLKDLPASTRPREKMLALGPASLVDAELLALLLRTGTRGVSVLQFAQQLLDRFGGIAPLLQAGPPELRRIKGLGPAKRAELAAVLELARRSLRQEFTQGTLFDSPGKVKDYLRMQLAGRGHEVFAVLFLDAQNRFIVLEIGRAHV